jgi:hypothetical protein
MVVQLMHPLVYLVDDHRVIDIGLCEACACVFVAPAKQHIVEYSYLRR